MLPEKYLVSGMKAMIGFRKDIRIMEKLRREDPRLYEQVIEKVKRDFEDAELGYVDKLDEEELECYYAEPFCDFPRGMRFPLHAAELFYLFSSFLKILDLPKGSEVLDLGCGSGWVSVFLAKLGYRVTGLDVAPKRIEIAKRKASDFKVDAEFVVRDAEQLGFVEAFDGILSHGTLHHCLDERIVLRNCWDALKIPGKLLLIEPGPRHHLSKQSIETVKNYSTIERGFTTAYLKSILRQSGFRRITCFVSFPCICDDSMWHFAKYVAKTFLSRILYTRFQSNVILAEK